MSDFVFVSRRSITSVPFEVYDATKTLVNADAPPQVTMKRYSDNTVVFGPRAMTAVETGVYEVTISSVESGENGLFYLEISYTLGAVAQEWQIDIEIPSTTSSAYEALADTDRAIVEQTWSRFTDMFDSATGGPHLSEYAQSDFGRERLAQLLPMALNRVNLSSQPPMTFTLEMQDFPYPMWGGFLELALYIEAIRHLIRSYTEQPTPQGLQTVRLDRAQYAQMWRQILQDELKDFESMQDAFKISSLNLGRASVLVGGGVYGEWMRPAPVTRPRHRPPVRLW